MNKANDSSYNPMDSFITFPSIYDDHTMVQFKDVEMVVEKRIKQAIVFGVKVGAASLTLIIMWMTSKKRTTPIFLINESSLFLTIIHASLYFGYLLSGFGSVVYNMTSFSQLITTNDIHLYAATNIFELLLVASIEASLVFQVKVMFANNNRQRWTWFLIALSIGMALATVSLYFTTAVDLIKSAYNTGYSKPSTHHVFYNVSLILLASSVNLMTLMLVIKLVLAIRSRRFLGLKQFDSFHILLIMSCQTLIAPSILFILSWVLEPTGGNDILVTVGQLLIVLSLPLSSLWATATNASSSSSSMSYDNSSFGNNSLYSKSTWSPFKKLFTSRFHSKPANDDRESENTFLSISDLEKNISPEVGTSINEESKLRFDFPDQNGSMLSQKKASYVQVSGKGSLFSDASYDSSPLGRISTANSDDLPPHISYMYDDDEGLVESKKIFLKNL